MHPALRCICDVTRGTPLEGRLFLVGGAVRDAFLGGEPENDFDIVLEGDALRVAWFLYEARICETPPVTFPRFGTAMVRIQGVQVELVTARCESYAEESRKPFIEPATLLDDALRRDFTVNTLMQNLHTGERVDALGTGVADLTAKILRTPLEPAQTFYDDPLRMLRAVRFRWKLGFDYAEGLEEALADNAYRLEIISAERIRDEFSKMLGLPDSDECMRDLMRFGLFEIFAPEFIEMQGVEQGDFHHLDVWEHSLLVLKNAGPDDLVLALASLLHDVGKPQTRVLDDGGRTRFFGHEKVSGDLAATILKRLRYPNDVIEAVIRLVRNHMRITSMPHFTPAAARRLLRDMGDDTDRLIELVEADAKSLKPGVKSADLGPAKVKLAEVCRDTPRSKLESPLSGLDIMCLLGVSEGPMVGKMKEFLLDQVLEGNLRPDDREAAIQMVKSYARNATRQADVHTGI